VSLLGAVGTSSSATSDGSAGARLVTDREAERWKPDMRRALKYANDRAGDVSFSVVDVRHHLHQRSGYSEANMASTFKVMLMVAYLRQGSVKNRGLNDYDRGLIQPMIRRSDNTTATRIRDMLGRGPIERLADLADMRSFEWNSIWGLCRTTSRDQAFFLHNLERYVPDRHWDFARKELASITPSQRWGIGQVDVRGWHLYFKGGWGSGIGAVNHQNVLLTKDGRKIGMSVLTEDSPSHAYGTVTLEGVFQRLLHSLPR